MDRLPKIGLYMSGGAGWIAGIHYIQNIASCLQYLPSEERPTVVLLVDPATERVDYEGLLDDHTIMRPVNNPKLIAMLVKLMGRYRTWGLREAVKASEVDVLFPVVVPPVRSLPVRCIGWIADFQHIRLPEMFSASEQRQRSDTYRRLAAISETLVFSSQDALNDFDDFMPGNKNRKRILPFSAVLSGEEFEKDVLETRDKYNLPERFLFLSNQFWKHKNHLVAFKAIKLLRDKGLDIKLYCSGSLDDYRNPDYCDSLRRYLETNNLGSQVKIMGLLPREDQLQIMRLATALVQPTLFEGRSTVIEEGRSLGKVMFVSDLPVNIEQAAEGSNYFQRHSPEDLADKIEQAWPGLKTCPNLTAERGARAANTGRFADFARTFVAIAAEAAQS